MSRPNDISGFSLMETMIVLVIVLSITAAIFQTINMTTQRSTTTGLRCILLPAISQPGGPIMNGVGRPAISSRRAILLDRLKFVRTFHQPWPDYIEGQEHGGVEYALLRSEWEQA